jgi:hypothetical protein
MTTTKKYILKPGRHQFVPGSHAIHENENLNDAEAEWYLKRYPHIAALFDTIPGNAQPATDTIEPACRVSVEETSPSPIPETVESPHHSDSYRDGEITTHQSVESSDKISEIKK